MAELESQTKPPLPSKGEDSAALGMYHSLVVDSGPLIRLAGSTELWRRARSYYTVPAVLGEIRDAKARDHLSNLPFELQVREPTPEGVKAVTEFARLTGDYHSLSSVDLQVLGLLYDLEREANGGCVAHVRTTPKRIVGLGPIATLGIANSKAESGGAAVVANPQGATNDPAPRASDDNGNDADDARDSSGEESSTDSEDENSSFDEQDDDDDNDSDDSVTSHDEEGEQATVTTAQKTMSWAAVVAPASDRASRSAPVPGTNQAIASDQAVHSMFGSITIGATAGAHSRRTDDDQLGQFSDAEEDDEEDEGGAAAGDAVNAVEEELKLDFPSLAAASTVPYVDDDNDNNKESLMDMEDPPERLRRQLQAEEERKQQSLRPVSNSGKLYNSFRKYGDLMKPKPKSQSQAKPEATAKSAVSTAQHDDCAPEFSHNQSRIMGGMTLAGQEDDVDDDGEGWITTTAEIRSRKAGGLLDPTRSGAALSNARALQGPPIHERSACATTDFAMQNVILQMNLELLSVDGVKVRKLKSFVTRCGACYKIYTSNERSGPLGKRLFCDKCGSDMMQRIAASVDSKTGRLRLHLSKRYKHNLRGTKFSLPKPGTGDRFKGDLLLREDQLLMGAWNQKVKMSSGGKARASAQSMFGKDLASNVGCNASAVDDDIRVGFGRRNPNAVKGRERRGKRKKTSEKACGLRRY